MKRILTDHGNYYIFCAPDGALMPDAESIFRTAARTGADLLYADEIVRDDAGTERRIVKPGASPDTLLSYNYVGSPFALSETLLERAGTPASASPAERWAFTLRAFQYAAFILRIPRALYIGPPERTRTDSAVVQTAIERLGRHAAVTPGRACGTYTVRYDYPPDTLVSVIVAATGDRHAVRRTLESVDRSNMTLRIEYLVADGGAPDVRAEAYYESLERAGAIALREWYQNNAARLFNRAAERAKGEVFLLLRAGDLVESTDALMYLTGYALQEHIGAAAAYTKKQETAAFPIVRNVPVILRAPMIARHQYFELGGMDESFAQYGCEAAMCKTLRDRRYNLLETPDAIIHPGALNATMGEKNAMRCKDMEI